MLSNLFALRRGELRRLAPFFGLYLLLFAALSALDGLSLSLFVQRVGSDQLPLAVAFAAAANLAFIGLYLRHVDHCSSRLLLHVILGVIAVAMVVAWLGLRGNNQGLLWCGGLFVVREAAYTLVLMHFGTYLQAHFDREALDRAFPIVYAGGRVGGILGGWLLSSFAAPLGMANFALLVALLSLAACLGEVLMAHAIGNRRLAGPLPSRMPMPADPMNSSDACHSYRAFLQFVWHCPLLFWITAASLIFVGGRWVLNYQYNRVFEQHFADDAAMARFLGNYTQIALTLSLGLQLLAVNRLRTWLGPGGAHCLYAVLVLAALLTCMVAPGMLGAVFARFVECELRYALRNPAAQWMTNVFSRPLRIRVRAWSLGLLVPLGTLVAAAGLTTLDMLGGSGLIAVAGLLVGVCYVATSTALIWSTTATPSPAANNASC